MAQKKTLRSDQDHWKWSDYWPKCLFMDKDTPWSQQNHHSLIQLEWIRCVKWILPTNIKFIIPCLPLFLFSTPLYYQLPIYMENVPWCIALCPFDGGKLPQIPPFCILHLQMWMDAHSAGTFCHQKAIFYPPGFNYTLNTEIIKRYDLIAEVSPTTREPKLFFLFNKQNAAFHSSFEHSCGTLNSRLAACTLLFTELHFKKAGGEMKIDWPF